MILLAFDRDETVETGNRIPGPITISLIKKLHSRPFIDVWAIGNQRLVEEANIPGLLSLAHQLSLTKDVVAGKPEIIGMRSSPERNVIAKLVRLSFLGILYSPHKITQKIVIDDYSLTHNTSGFKHYYPQDFLNFINNKGL